MRLKIIMGVLGISLFAVGSASAAGMGGGHMGGGGMHMGGGGGHMGGGHIGGGHFYGGHPGFAYGGRGFRGGRFAYGGGGIYGGYPYDGDYAYDYGYNDPAYYYGPNGDGTITGRSAAEEYPIEGPLD